jgi:hypothetical protein
MEKRNIAYLARLKCEESNHYSSNCLLYERCWLLCTSYGEYKGARKCEDLEIGGTARFFYSTQKKSYVNKECSFTKHSTLLHVWTYIFLCYAYGPLKETVWSIHGTLVLWMDQLWRLIFFFSNSCRGARLAKFDFLKENRAMYLKQYFFCVPTQHVPVFLSIMLNWSIEDNLTLYIRYRIHVISPIGSVIKQNTCFSLLGTCYGSSV